MVWRGFVNVRHSACAGLADKTNSMLPGGAFVISLDFELLWGVRDKRTVADYGANILGVRKAVPAMLDLFGSRGIACTWATVGFLFCADRDELLASFPALLPQYADRRLSPYEDMAGLGRDEDSDPYRFGPSLLRQVQAAANQEIGTHTFSHFYCLEQGGTPDAFRADLAAAKAVAQRRQIELRSIAFPRNQYARAHFAVCRELGITSFRGNEHMWFHRATAADEQSLPMRAARLADSYVSLGGAHVRSPEVIDGLVDIPSSRFLRPARPGGRLEVLRLRRIRAAMDAAARRDAVFHLWWHPHNFGVNLGANLSFLAAILDHFAALKERTGMRSMTMASIADEVRNGRSPRGAADR
jgi:hypothetical protein